MKKNLRNEIEKIVKSDMIKVGKVTGYLEYLRELEEAGISTKSEYSLPNANSLDEDQIANQRSASNLR